MFIYYKKIASLDVKYLNFIRIKHAFYVINIYHTVINVQIELYA